MYENEPKVPFAKCDQCPLRDCPVVVPYYPSTAKVVVIGEAPGREEVDQGRPFVGQSGKLLAAILTELGRDFDNDCARTNVVCCRPPANREPTAEEVDACKERLDAELFPYATLPKLVVGKVAKLALTGEDAPRGVWIGNILPTWHPAYVLRKPSAFGDLKRDIAEVFGKRTSAKLNMRLMFIETVDEMFEVLNRENVKNDWMAVDIETDNIHWYETDYHHADDILYVQLTFDGRIAIIIPREVLLEPRAIEMLNEVARTHKTYMHNGMFDATFLKHQLGVEMPITFDTMLAHYVLNENGAHGLKALGLEFLGLPDWESDLKTYLRSRNDRYSKVPREVMIQYAATDVIVTFRLGEMFAQALVREGLYTKPFQSVLMRALPMLQNMKMKGLAVDVPYLQKLLDVADNQMLELNNELESICGHEINPNSNPQVQAVVWDERGLRPNKGSKVFATTPRSTSVDAIEHLHSFDPNTGARIREGDAFVDKLLEYRHVAKMRSSYVVNLLESADVNGRVHSDILLHGTEIGRLAFRDPALQTIPRPADWWGKALRGSIIAGPGNLLGICDYSQAELRVAAALSGDPFLIDAYNNDRDIHTEMSIKMFGENWTKEQRVMVKMFNFAYLYGGNEWSFSQSAGLPIEKAKAFVRDYNKVMVRANEWKKETFAALKRDGYVETIFGRRRRFPLITEANVEDARKACVHFLVASTANDLAMLAACAVYEKGIDCVLTVHDSVIIETPEDRMPYAIGFLEGAMEQTGRNYLPEVKWKVDQETASRWVMPPEL